VHGCLPLNFTFWMQLTQMSHKACWIGISKDFLKKIVSCCITQIAHNTRYNQAVMDDWVSLVNNSIITSKSLPSCIVNINETNIYFNMTQATTLEVSGAAYSQHSKHRFHSMLYSYFRCYYGWSKAPTIDTVQRLTSWSDHVRVCWYSGSGEWISGGAGVHSSRKAWVGCCVFYYGLILYCFYFVQVLVILHTFSWMNSQFT